MEDTLMPIDRLSCDLIDPDFNLNCVFYGQHPYRPDIVIISPRNDPNRFRLKGGRQGARRTRQVLGPLFLCSHLTKYDGYKFVPAQLVADKEMAPLYQGRIVGFSVLPSNYLTAVEQAKVAKTQGAKMVIFGGPYASCREREIILNQPAVDYVIGGPGEIALSRLLGGSRFDDIPGLSYRSQTLDMGTFYLGRQGIFVNQREYYPLYKRAITNYDLWSKPPEDRFGIVYHQDGCPVGCVRPCHFCCASRTKPNRRTIDQVITEERQLAQLGYISLEDGGDSYAYGQEAGLKWLRLLADREQTEGLCFDRFVHVSVNDASYPGMMKALADVGVQVTQIGFETGDPAMMNFDKERPENVQKLIEGALEYGIRFFTSIVIGHPGETEESAMKSVELIYKMQELGLLFGIESEISCPFPGTEDFRRICKMYPNWANKDYIPSDVLMQAWIENFTHLTFDQAITIRNIPIDKLGDKVECTGSMNY